MRVVRGPVSLPDVTAMDEARGYLHPSNHRRESCVGAGACIFPSPPRSVADAGCGEPFSGRHGSMDAFWCLPLALLLLHPATCTGNGAEVTGAVGRSVTFRLQSPAGKAAAWSFQNDVIAFVKFGNPPEATFFDEKYKQRLTFLKDGSELTISQLRMDDAGTYTAQILGVKTTFTLHVYRELAVPTVTCAARNCSADGCRYTLHCTAVGSGSGNISYGWSTGGWQWSEGPIVLVEGSPLDESPLTCTARNPVSSRNTTVTSPAALCAENTTHPPATGTYSSGQAGIVAASVIGVLLAVVLFVICCKSKGWVISRLPAAEATNTVFCGKTLCQPTKKEPGAQP